MYLSAVERSRSWIWNRLSVQKVPFGVNDRWTLPFFSFFVLRSSARGMHTAVTSMSVVIERWEITHTSSFAAHNLSVCYPVLVTWYVAILFFSKLSWFCQDHAENLLYYRSDRKYNNHLDFDIKIKRSIYSRWEWYYCTHTPHTPQRYYHGGPSK